MFSAIDTAFVREDPQNPIIAGDEELMKLLSTENMVCKTLLLV